MSRIRPSVPAITLPPKYNGDTVSPVVGGKTQAVQQIGAGICDCQVNGLEITFYCLILGTVIHDWTEK